MCPCILEFLSISSNRATSNLSWCLHIYSLFIAVRDVYYHNSTKMCANNVINAVGGPPEMCTQEHKPIPKPRHWKRPSEVSCSGLDSYKRPMQETCRPAQTLISYLDRTDMAHLRQQGTPLVDQRGIVFSKTRRCTQPPAAEGNSSSHSQSTPVSPSLEKDSTQAKPPTKPGNVEPSLALN